MRIVTSGIRTLSFNFARMSWLSSAVWLVGALLLLPNAAHADISAVDVAGRTVARKAPAKRVVLAQGRHLPALSLVVGDPTLVLVGMGGDWKRQDAPTFSRYAAAFPRLAQVAIVGSGSSDTLSVEAILALDPDLVVMSRSLAGALDEQLSNSTIRRIEDAGVPVVIIDFYLHPLTDTPPSLLALGQLLGREKQARDFIAFYRDHLEAVRSALRTHAPTATDPVLLMQAHSGATPCCYAPGRGAFADMITAAGASSVSAALLPGVSGQLSPERLLVEPIDIFVGTGGSYQEAQGGLVLGTGVTLEKARYSLRAALAQPALAALKPVRDGHAFGLWQLFNDTPLNVLAVEVLAKWSHPDRFATMKPEDTLRELNKRFFAVPMVGTYWIEN